MDGSLGKRALNLLRGAVGGRESHHPPALRPDVLEQAVEQAVTNGHVPASTPAVEMGRPDAPSDPARALRRELEASLAMIFTSAADAIVTVDDGQRIMMFNRAAE